MTTPENLGNPMKDVGKAAADDATSSDKSHDAAPADGDTAINSATDTNSAGTEGQKADVKSNR